MPARLFNLHSYLIALTTSGQKPKVALGQNVRYQTAADTKFN